MLRAGIAAALMLVTPGRRGMRRSEVSGAVWRTRRPPWLCPTRRCGTGARTFPGTVWTTSSAAALRLPRAPRGRGRSGPATAAGPGRPTRWAAALARTLDAAGGVPGTAATTSPISLAESRTTERRDDVATVDLDASPSSCRGVSVATERPPHAAPRRPTPPHAGIFP